MRSPLLRRSSSLVTAGLVLAIAGCHVPGKRPAPGLVAQLHAAGAHVVCYLSAGSWEDWRPDRQRYPAGVIGKAYDGWVREDAGRTRWALNDYADEGQRNERWFGASVRKVHRTIATLINGLADAGLTIERIVEPIPSAAWLEGHPSTGDERRRPMFLLVRARKG